MTELTEKAKMLAGKLYNPNTDPELLEESQRAQLLLHDFNHSIPGSEVQTRILKTLLGGMGENVMIRPSFYCDYGWNIFLGDHVFLNFNCVFLDCAPITLGNNVLLAPAVQIYTPTHPMDAATRRRGQESAKPVTIGDNVWIGGGAIILPGVTIGDNSVIGAGSIVNKSIPPNVMVAGNPAKVIRDLS